MKPKLFRLSDLLDISIPLFMAGLIIYTFMWNKLSVNGEPISVIGSSIAGIITGICLTIVIVYYVLRHEFISQYKYTTKHGIACYFGPNSKIYLKLDVENCTDTILNRWVQFAPYVIQPLTRLPANAIRNGVTCMFRYEGDFVAEVGWWKRRVYGYTLDKTIVVGQGNKPVDWTAFGHELSHIIINYLMDKDVPENEAHKIFTQVGV
jgi:hypothetical protein